MPRGGPSEIEYVDNIDLITPLIAADPAGLEPRREYDEFPVEPIAPVQRAPQSYLYDSEPLPGPYAVAFVMVDYDSARWWGKGYETVWDTPSPLSGDLPSDLPDDLSEHIDVFSTTNIGRYPNIVRGDPVAFGSLVPPLDPNEGR